MNLLQPKKLKYKKYHKKISNFIKKNYFQKELKYGIFGLKALENARISSRQIEAVRKIIKKTTKRNGMLWINIFPSIPITAKPAEIRMGKGKGNIKYWGAFVKQNSILFELSGISSQLGYKALSSAADKLSFKTFIVYQKR